MQKNGLFLTAGLLMLAATGCTVGSYTLEDAFVPDAGLLDTAPTTSDAGHDAGRRDAGPALDTSHSCMTQDLHSDLGAAVTIGTTLGATDLFTPTCGGSAGDAWFSWTAPIAGTYAFDTDGSDFDTVLTVMRGCRGPEIDCNDDVGFGTFQSAIQAAVTAGQTVIIVIDGYGTGHYVLNINAIPPEICDDRVDNDGDFYTDCEDSDCAAFSACDESMHCSDRVDNDLDFDTDCLDSDCSSMAICLETGANCADGIDNDVDGTTDCADADCAAIPSCSESMNCADHVDNDADDLVDCADSNCATNAICATTETDCNNGLDDDDDTLVDCADPNCTAHCAENTPALCMNTTDDDADGLIDCADLQCSCSTACPPAVAPSTTCPDQDLAMAIGDGVYHGTFTGYACGARADASCGTTHGAGSEIELAWTAPANGTYVFDTEDSMHAGGVFDTILTLRTQCAGGAASEFGCDDDGGTGRLSTVSHFLVGGQSVLIVIDSQNVWDGGNVTLNIHAM